LAPWNLGIYLFLDLDFIYQVKNDPNVSLSL